MQLGLKYFILQQKIDWAPVQIFLTVTKEIKEAMTSMFLGRLKLNQQMSPAWPGLEQETKK